MVWGKSYGVWKQHKPVTAEQKREVVNRCREEGKDPHSCFLGGDLKSYPVCDKDTCNRSKYGETAANIYAQIYCTHEGEVGERARHVLKELGKECKRASKRKSGKQRSPRGKRRRRRSRSPESQ